MLAAIAMHAPKDEKELAKIRGMSADIARGRTGQKILKYMKIALETPKDEWPKVKKTKPLQADEAACLDALKMLLKIEATQNGVAGRLLAGKDDLEAIAKNKDDQAAAMKGWRYDVFGQYAAALKDGRLAIGMKDGKIVKFEINESTGLHNAA